MSWDRIFRPNGYGRHEPVLRDPLSIGVWLAVNVGWSGTITAFGATIVGSLVVGAAGIGLSLLSNAFFSAGNSARPQTPSERQATVRQSVGARTRYIGRVAVGGTVGFFENVNGYLFQMATLNWGQIQGVVGRYLNDVAVTISSDGYVQNSDFWSDGVPAIRMLYKYGEPNQTAHDALVSNFPDAIDENFRLRNMANYLAIFNEVKREDIARVYPQLNPSVRHIIDASLIERVRQYDIAWSDNNSDAIYDYLVGRDGAGFPWGLGYQKSQINLATFQEYADVCDRPQLLKVGGSIKQFRLCGGYGMTEEARQVLPRLASAGDADLYMDTEGKIAIRGGQWVAPRLTLDMDKGHIVSADFRHGNGALSAFNELTITYTEPDLDYQETECDPWIDASNIALRGAVLPGRLALPDVPHFAQARRLGKIHTHRSNPEWSGTIVTNFYGMNAIGEDMVRIKFPLLGIDDDFSIRRIRILDNFTGVELSIASFPSSAYDWDAELEEGTAPGSPPDTSTPINLLPPDDINVSAAERDLGGGGTGIFLVVTWTEPERTSLAEEVEYMSLPGGAWVPMVVSDGVGLAESGLVSAGIDYSVRVRTRSPGGGYSDWSDPLITIEATPDTSAADPVTDISGAGGEGAATIEWEMSPDSHSIGARVYRNTVNNSAAATLIATVYGSPTTPAEYRNEIAAGTYYYWIASWTGSFVEGSRTSVGSIVVT